MNHKELLLQIYEKSFHIENIPLPQNILSALDIILENIGRNKGVYTVLITLLTHKVLYPNQDIRYFQDKMPNGFSARTIDTKFITPTLKELGLPSMSESGWLTRSLEQPYPYTLDYKGEISGKGMKQAFLLIVDFMEKSPNENEKILQKILHSAIQYRENNKVPIRKLSNADEIFILDIITILDNHFNYKYNIHGGSKLPVLAFYAIYQELLHSIYRYNNCILEDLGSHTASDKTSKSAGDIQIFKNQQIEEAIEIKLDKEITLHILQVAYEKIIKFNPKRYYILSYIGILEEEEPQIYEMITKIKNEHGCQVIINGVIDTLKYYLRLIDEPKKFLNTYIELVEKDTELQPIHKQILQQILKKYF